MSTPKTSYTFVSAAGRRNFFHRWHYDYNGVIECNKCSTSCSEEDPFSQHWHLQNSQFSEDADNKLTAWRLSPLMQQQEVIVSNDIEFFTLCDGRSLSNAQQFLNDARFTAIPNLLSMLFATEGCEELMVALTFYVEIGNDCFMFKPSDLFIQNYRDIHYIINWTFVILLGKLRAFTAERRRYRGGGGGFDDGVYSITKININVQRRRQGSNKRLYLPIQYEPRSITLKETDKTKSNESCLRDLSVAFRNHLNSTETNVRFTPPFPCNIYCFRTCPKSLDTYAVPYHISNTSETSLSARCYLIIDDILGQFKELLEIDIKKILQVSQEVGENKIFISGLAEDEVISCSVCKVQFAESTYLPIHKMLSCERLFEILQIDNDFHAVSENNIELMRCNDWFILGATEHKL